MLTSNGYVLDEEAGRLGALDPVPAADRDDRDALWSRLRRDGYLYLPGHLDPAVVREFRAFYFDKLAATGLVQAGAMTGSTAQSQGRDPAGGLGHGAAGGAGHRAAEEGLGHDPAEGFVHRAAGELVHRAAGGPVDRGLLRRLLFEEIVPSPEYQALCSHTRIRDWFSWMLEDEVHLHRRKIIRHTVPGENGIGTATQAHYDLVYLREGTDRVLSIWIPLGDCPRVLGGLTYLEGSHLRIMAEEASGTLKRPAASITADLPGLAEEHDSRWLVTDYAAGDVVVHSAHMIHAALDNVDPDGVMRLSTDIRYQRTSDPIDWRWQEHWHDRDGL